MPPRCYRYRQAQVPAIAAATIAAAPSSRRCSARGMNRPRLLRKIRSARSRLARGPGSGLQHREIPEQQLDQQRDVAECFDVERAGRRRTSPFDEQRAMPMTKPSTVANMIESAVTSSVLSSATTKADI